MKTPLLASIAVCALACATFAACSGGSSAPKATPTPTVPGAEDAIGEWVKQNRNVAFVGDCHNAQPGVDVGKLCVAPAGERGTRRAYSLGPTFSESTALAIVEQQQDSSWSVLSVTNNDPSQREVPGIAWPLEVGDQVLIVGLADCLSVRELPTQTAKRTACQSLGTKAIIQDGPVSAETFTWWKIAGDGFNGWAVDKYMRLPEAVAQALQPGASGSPTPAQ